MTKKGTGFEDIEAIQTNVTKARIATLVEKFSRSFQQLNERNITYEFSSDQKVWRPQS